MIATHQQTSTACSLKRLTHPLTPVPSPRFGGFRCLCQEGFEFDSKGVRRTLADFLSIHFGFVRHKRHMFCHAFSSARTVRVRPNEHLLQKCIDINECLEDDPRHTCGDHSTCNNTVRAHLQFSLTRSCNRMFVTSPCIVCC